MSVYSKCLGTNCPVSSTCFRYTAPPVPKNQPWLCMIVACKDLDENGCKFYIEDEEKENAS